MAARLVSSQLIQTIQSGGRSIAVEYVDKTTSWIRPSNFPAQNIKNEFVEVVKENIGILQPTTSVVAMKESEHQSAMDKRMHYTVFELDQNRQVVCTSHLVKQK